MCSNISYYSTREIWSAQSVPYEYVTGFMKTSPNHTRTEIDSIV